jgi:hypothetical protein
MEHEVLAVRKRVLGAEHPNTLTVADNLTASLARQGKYDEAEKMEREVLAEDAVAGSRISRHVEYRGHSGCISLEARKVR